MKVATQHSDLKCHQSFLEHIVVMQKAVCSGQPPAPGASIHSVQPSLTV